MSEIPALQKTRSAPAHRYSTLRLSLILPFIALIAMLTGGLGMMWYWTGTRTVSALSQQLMQEMAERIGQAVQTHLQNSGAMLQAVYPDGLTAGADIRQDLAPLRMRLWAATSLSGHMGDYVHYGNLAGQNIGLLRQKPAQAQLRLKLNAQDHRVYYQLDGITAKPVALSTESTVFDPRTRPWFQAAQKASGDLWTPVYIDFNARDLVMTRVHRVLSPTGEFQGAVATDLFLNALQRFISELPMAKGGQAMLLEPDGALIAISGSANIATGADGKPERIYAERSGNALLKASFAALQSAFKTASDEPHRSLVIDTADGKVQVAWQRIRDDAGLNWLAIVALPHKEMLAGVRRDIFLLGAIGLLALGIALIIGLRIFGGVAKDMRTLTHAVRRVGDGDIDVPIQVQRNDEIAELAHNFQHMRHNLFTDPLTGVGNRSALNHLLATLIRESPTDEPLIPFALLFIDLNRFKPLNDRWGHENGDLALIEVAQRMRDRLRGDDFIARLGGDEFVIVARAMASDEQARAAGEQLRTAIQAPLRTLRDIPAGESVSVGAAIGHALFPRDGMNPSDLLKHADEAMYRDKPATGER